MTFQSMCVKVVGDSQSNLQGLQGTWDDGTIWARTSGGGATSFASFFSASEIAVLMFYLLYGWPPLSGC
jgi:hypothetical protein